MKATLRNKATQSNKMIASSSTDRPGRTTRDDFKHEGTIAGLYDLGETIGKGHYAVVKLARHVFTGEKVAVKVIDKSRLDEISKSHLFQEVRCMKLVQHANVVKLYQVIDTQSKLYLILELGDGGDMYDYIMKHEKGLSEELARHYFLQIVNAIDFCHKLHVVHRDLKPENVVFFKKTDTVKLTDFGFSNKFVPGNKLDTSCGSLAYSAPEILLGDSYDAPAVDIWSMGVILYMLVCGQAPFQEANDSETLTMIMDCKYNIPGNISESCKDLIKKMLVREPCDRAKLEDIMAHPWLNASGAVVPQEVEVPLVCQKELSIEDHNCIVEKMINGNFATVHDISESLSKHKYDHITATYYLLAERLLRKRRGSLSLAMPEAAEVAPAATTTNVADASKPLLSPLALSPRSSNPSCNLNRTPCSTTPSSAGGVSINLEKSRTPFDCLVSPPSSHVSPANSTNYLNRLSSGHQGDDDDEEDDDVGSLNRSKDKLFFPLTFTNLTSASPTLLSGFSQLSSKSFLPPPPPPSAMRPLFSVQSSPQLLNEICEEEGESDDDDDNKSATNLIQRHQMKQSPSYTCGKSLSSTMTAAFAPAGNSESVCVAENNKLENARKKRFAEKKRAAIGRNNNIRNAFNVSSSEDVSDSEESKQQQQPGRHFDRKQQQQQKDSLQQQQHKRQINRLQQNSCKGADFSRKDSSEHSSDTDGPGSFHGRGRNLMDRYHQHHHHLQQQQGTHSSSGNNHERKQPQSENDANDNLSENVSEIDCDEYAEFQRSRSARSSRDLSQINMLKAALIKLNIACSDDNDDECDSYDYDFDDKLSGLSSTNSNSRSRRNSKKLFSVLEENSSYPHHQQQHLLSSLSSSSVSSAFKFSSTSPVTMTTMMLAMRCNERKASSMMNISNTFQCSNCIDDNNADDSLNFLDLHALKYKENKYSLFDDKSRSGAWCYNNATNNIKASLHRSVDCNLNNQSVYSDYYSTDATSYYNDLSFGSKLSWQNDLLGRIGYHDISLLA